MSKLLSATRRLAIDTKGVTALEYGLIAAGIAVAIIVAVNQLGTDLSGLFGRISSSVSSAAGGGAGD